MDPAGPDGTDDASAPVGRGVPAFAVGIAVALVVRAMHGWSRNGADPLVWNDTADYVASSKLPLWSVDRWLGERPPLMPLVLSAAGGSFGRFVTIQTVISALAWGVLGWAVAAAVRPTWRRLVAGGGVVLLALVWPVAMWDQQVLTESLALSGLALVAAAAVRTAAGVTPLRVAGLIGACAWWLAVRDSHLVPVGCGALVLAIAAWRGWLRPRGDALAASAFLLALVVLVLGAAGAGDRDRLPLEHVYAARVLPYADRVEWFADHGMPDAHALEAIPEATSPGRAPFTPVPPVAQWARWRAWLAADGRATLLRYALTHPTYLVREPMRDPERVFNNAGGLRGYEPLTLRRVTPADRIADPATWVALAIGLAGAALAWLRRVLATPLAAAGLVIAATAAPHALVVWHSDGMESARHLLIPGIQLRLGVLLVVLAALVAERTPAAAVAGPETREPELDEPEAVEPEAVEPERKEPAAAAPEPASD
jgi:hypothetical protein